MAYELRGIYVNLSANQSTAFLSGLPYKSPSSPPYKAPPPQSYI